MNPKRATDSDHEIKCVEFEQNTYNSEELTANALKSKNVIWKMSGVMGIRG